MKDSTEKEIIKLTLQVMSKIEKLSQHSVEELKKLYPFHGVFFPDDALPYAKKERSIVTQLGMSYYPLLAEILAKERHHDVHREYIITQEVDVAKLNLVNSIVNDLRGNRAKPDHYKETDSIFNATNGSTQTSRVIADLYIGDHEAGEMFIELKSPMPNLDVCDESKRKMLTFLAMKKEEGKKAQAWFGLTYNPYGEGNPYKWSFTKKIMDMQNQVLVGKPLWELIGGQGTFDELLAVMKKAKEIHSSNKEKQVTLN